MSKLPKFNPNNKLPAVGQFLNKNTSISEATTTIKSGSVSDGENASTFVNTPVSGSAINIVSIPQEQQVGVAPTPSTPDKNTSRTKSGSRNRSESASVGFANFIDKANSPKFEDLHSKTNVWIENDLLTIIEEIQKNTKQGIKKTIFNEALRMYMKANGLID